MLFDPEQDHEGWLNLWKGWAVEPKRGDWSLLRGLIRDLLTDGDGVCYEYVLNWMAFMFQPPREVTEVAIAFRGAKGMGKGTLGRTVGRFNSHLQNCVCLFADEAFWGGRQDKRFGPQAACHRTTLNYEGRVVTQ